MDAKVLVVFLIVLVLAFSTARQGKHLNVRRIGGKTSMRSYILYKVRGQFQREFLRNSDFSPF